MKNIKTGRPIVLLLLSLWFLPRIFGQSQAADPGCTASGAIRPTAAFITYGTGIKMKNSTRRMRMTVGQPLVGSVVGDDNNNSYGFWTSYLVPPLPPAVKATQGELLDRIQLSWTANPLGAIPVGGFKIYRDSIFIAQVDKNTRNYNDYNVIAGKNYIYEVRGINLFGEGPSGQALGFQVSNGVVTGWVRTLNGSAVPGAQVTLSPMQGYSGRFGQFDGAKATAATATGGHFFPTTAGDWSLTFWVKNNMFGSTVDIMRINGQHLAVRSNGGGLLAVEIPGATVGSIQSVGALLPTGNDGTWHHLALTYGSGQYRLYMDGTLADLKNGVHIPTSSELYIGANTPFQGWAGGLDELRIYHRRLEELDLQEVMTGTASSLTPGLKYYWKMDEGAGSKSFDIVRRSQLLFCGAIFDLDRPPVPTAAMTDDRGYYRIESASYGTGTTFLATPKKDFYKHRALKFLPDENDRAELPDFSLTDKATLETWANQSEPQGTQTILQKKWGANAFVLQTEAGVLRVVLNGVSHDFGSLGIGYHHLALTIAKNLGNTQIEVFKDGAPVGSHAFPAISGDWSDPGQPWILGAEKTPGNIFSQFFNGLVDEVAVYDTTLSQTKIQTHFQNERDPQERGLRVYFPLDEGTGSKLTNAGSVLIEETGTVQGAEWTVLANFQQTTPHVFAPEARQVTLNPSVTSVDQVDFTDRSTVAVSGFVRYAGSDCFAERVEILVNGESYSPAIVTDSTGKFVIDLEPGASVELRPKFSDHQFSPAFVNVTNVIAPLAGIVFNDLTVREISGQVAGGDCKKSIISNPGSPTGTVCTVKVSATNGCFEKQITIDNAEGEYVFENLPPLEMTVAVVEHSDPTVKTAFQVQGGVQVDLSEKQDTVVDFIYHAPPEVELNGLDEHSPTCPIFVLEQHDLQTINIKAKETYYNNEVCYLDTAAIKLVNGFEDSVRLLTLRSTAGINYSFKVGAPIASPPFLKTLQVVATTISGDETSLVVQGLVTGIRNKQNTFTTQIPTEPTLILHDPPGDGSSAFFEQGQKVCRNVQFTLESEGGVAGGIRTFLGADNLTLIAPGGFGPVFWLDVENTAGFEAYNAYQKVNDSTYQTCTSFNKRISTSDNDLVVGAQGGDVFVGSGFNLEFGFADLVELDTNNCTGMVSTVLNVEPDSFSTTYIYSEWAIVSTIIPYLDSLRVNPATSSADSLKYAQSINLWNKVLDDNQKRKDTMTVRQNISFDAGVTYEYSETSDTTSSSSTGNAFHSEGEVGLEYGFSVNFVGFVVNAGVRYSVTTGKAEGSETEKGITTGYTLADDDLLDLFSVDVGIDPKYKTAMFRTRTGQSSCPWEPGTAHREGNSMQFRDGSGPVALDVPADQPATFLFTLGNNSETNETWTYAFTAGPESNPHGAKISVNGAPLDVPLMFAVPWGTSIPITVTLERGPIEYDYDSLEVVFYSLCEDQRANELGILPDDDKILYSAQYISAHFIKPCSEVDITVPEQNWVIFPDPNTPGNDDLRRITISGYDKQNTDFERIRVQYRRADGDGAWLNIVAPASGGNPDQDATGAIARHDLGNVFTQFYWETAGLADGDYELRAVSICSGNVADRPGYSHIVRGRIQRQPPGLLGLPQPSDGVYHVGDEISFTFNKDINCQKINGLDNVLLFDATTDLPVNIDISCKDNEIFIDPRFDDNSFFENRIFRAELHDIEDLVGNLAENPIQDAFPSKFGWEFYVDRNELAWLTDSLGMTKFEDETKTVIAKVHNRGGYPAPFELLDVPSWVRVVPNTGTLAPNEVRDIRFEVDSVLPFGHWSDSIVLRTLTGQNPFFMGGDEGLPFGVRVVCRPPDWDFDPQAFTNSMNMVLKLKVQGQFSTDPEDMVVAFLGNQVVGRSHLEFVPQTGEFLAFLTVYGETAQQNAPLRLEIWDASACLRFGILPQNFTFQPDNVVGTPAVPQVIETSNSVLRDVPIGAGWNWLSFNLAFADPNLNPALASLHRPANDLIRSQTQFSTYSGSTWVGSLAVLENTKKYVFKADLADTLRMEGTVLDPATTPIPVVAGWNWVGYIPKYPLPVNDALASLNPASGDLIKSQTEFAQFLPGFGWVGNLKFMQAPQGYELKLTNAGTLIYPPPQNRPAVETRSIASLRGGGGGPVSGFWAVDPSRFEHSATLIGMLKMNDSNATTGSMELGAFVGGEVRGVAQAIQIPGTDGHVFFLTAYANAAGEKLEFKLFDAATGAVLDLQESMSFSPDQHQGSIAAPLPFTLKTTGAVEQFLAQSFEVSPNPFHTETAFRFSLPEAQEVALTVLDIAGRTVWEERFAAREGPNARAWKARTADGGRLEAGIYFVRLEAQDGSAVRKLVLH